MRKVTLASLYLLLSAIFFMCASLKPAHLVANVFTIDGDVSGSKDKIEKVKIIYILNGNPVEDSAKVKNGRFYLRGTIYEPTVATLSAVFADKSKYAGNMLFIEPGAIKAVCGSSFEDMTFSGSRSNIEFEKWNTARKPVDKSLDSIWKVSGDLESAYKANGKKRSDSLKLIAIDHEVVQILHRRREFDVAYLKDNTNSVIAPYLMNFLIQDRNYAPLMEAIYKQFPVSSQNSALGKSIRTHFALAIGSIAPDISVLDSNGHKIVLSSLRDKYVLLDYWASWCGWCRAENPYLIKAFNKYHDKFTILSVSLDTKEARTAWLNAIRQDGTGIWLNGSNLKGYNTTEVSLYGINVLPANFLIDKDGRIVAKNLRREELEKKLDELLK